MPVAATHLLWFLPFTVPIAIWVAWSDVKFMKIPNKAVLALFAVYLLVGLFIFPLNLWGWGWALAGIVMLAGFIGTAAGLMGAGDAKFAAAMAPFFAAADLRMVLALFAACLLGAFASHRLMRATPAFRAATPDWESWTNKDFPMGLALSGTLVFYPIMTAWLF
jgi:prepilin peptidase CpaA